MKILKVKCLAPTRLDNYLMQQYPALNPGRLNKALRENKIKLNGKKQPLSTRVMAGDEIKLFILDEVLDADRRVEGPAWKNARGPAQVVYDCPQIVIVNKPAGLAVDGPEDDTLLNRTLLYLNQQGEYKENDLYTPALCHRLDTGTSGLVIVAKTPEAKIVPSDRLPSTKRLPALMSPWMQPLPSSSLWMRFRFASRAQNRSTVFANCGTEFLQPGRLLPKG